MSKMKFCPFFVFLAAISAFQAFALHINLGANVKRECYSIWTPKSEFWTPESEQCEVEEQLVEFSSEDGLTFHSFYPVQTCTFRHQFMTTFQHQNSCKYDSGPAVNTVCEPCSQEPSVTERTIPTETHEMSFVFVDSVKENYQRSNDSCSMAQKGSRVLLQGLNARLQLEGKNPGECRAEATKEKPTEHDHEHHHEEQPQLALEPGAQVDIQSDAREALVAVKSLGATSGACFSSLEVSSSLNVSDSRVEVKCSEEGHAHVNIRKLKAVKDSNIDAAAAGSCLVFSSLEFVDAWTSNMTVACTGPEGEAMLTTGGQWFLVNSSVSVTNGRLDVESGQPVVNLVQSDIEVAGDRSTLLIGGSATKHLSSSRISVGANTVMELLGKVVQLDMASVVLRDQSSSFSFSGKHLRLSAAQISVSEGASLLVDDRLELINEDVGTLATVVVTDASELRLSGQLTGRGSVHILCQNNSQVTAAGDLSLEKSAHEPEEVDNSLTLPPTELLLDNSILEQEEHSLLSLLDARVSLSQNAFLNLQEGSSLSVTAAELEVDSFSEVILGEMSGLIMAPGTRVRISESFIELGKGSRLVFQRDPEKAGGLVKEVKGEAIQVPDGETLTYDL